METPRNSGKSPTGRRLVGPSTLQEASIYAG